MDGQSGGRGLRNSQRYFKDSESVVKLLALSTAGERSNIGEGEEEEEERRPRESDGRSLKIDSLARDAASPLRLPRTDRAVLHSYLVIGIYTRVTPRPRPTESRPNNSHSIV